MKPLTQRNSAVVVLLMAALVVAACTRSASTGVVPTATTAPQGVAGGNEPQPTDAMNALGTALALNITQTAIAQSSTGGGETPQPPPSGQLAVTPTPVPTTAVPPAAGATPTAGAACTSPYTVKQGDWIYKIARDCKVTPSAIIAANPGISPNFIIPGQKLNLPTAGATSVPAATAQAQACKGTYTVKSGDNLFRIAFNCGLTTEQMAAANGIAFPYIIHPGDVLKFP